MQACLLGRALYIIPKIIKHSTITCFNNPTCFEIRQLGAMIIPRILWLLCSLHSSCIHVPFCIHIWKKKKLIIIWIIAKKKGCQIYHYLNYAKQRNHDFYQQIVEVGQITSDIWEMTAEIQYWTSRYPDLGNASDWPHSTTDSETGKWNFISMKFLCWFLRLHFMRKALAAMRNVSSM